MLKKIIQTKKIMILSFTVLMGMSFTGCSSNSAESDLNTVASQSDTTVSEETSTNASTDTNTDASTSEADNEAATQLPNLEISFGQDSDTFILHLYDNDTAAEIAKDVGSADWNLPIYHFDDFENSDVMQYYDISDSYTIPSSPETSEKAGEVYYSDPNRIVLFYQDAEVTGEYTKVGYLESTNGLYDTVVNNPVIEGWGNKIVSIGRAK